LYVVLAGKGGIYLIRNGKIGTLLEQLEPTEILSSSGFLEHGDIVVLASNAFLEMVSKEKLFETLTTNTVSEAAELLSPTIHAATVGNAAAVFFQYEDDTPPASEEKEPEQQKVQEKEETQPQEEKNLPPQRNELPSDNLSHVTKEEPVLAEPLAVPHLSRKRPGVSHRRKMLLTIIVVLILVLGATVYFAIQKQKEVKNASLFHASFPQAEQKYQEAQGLMDLNPTLAKDDLESAQKQLTPLGSQLISGSTEQKQTQDLLGKVQNSLATLATANTALATKIDPAVSPLLAYAVSHSDISYFSEDATNIYTADDTQVTQITKKSSTAKALIPNKSVWGHVGGFQKYLDNFYLLDTKGGIFKFVPSGSSFTKSNYFASGVSPDLSHAAYMAIDGSVWILQKDGSILKFTKGKQDTFALTGLDSPLASPTRLVTSVDMSNVYILDNGNGRIVVTDKTGKFIRSYTTTLLKKATQLSVDEKNKTVLFITGAGMYKINL